MKPRVLDYVKLNQELITYTHEGYDLHFVHGWFTAYLSAPTDNEDDLLIPDYLIVDEDKINDEAKFSRFIDELMKLYFLLAQSLYEYNKPIKPLVDLVHPGFFDMAKMSSQQQRNLLIWLYGYLSGFMACGADFSRAGVNEEKLLNQRFYPALFTLCVALFALADKIKISNVANDFLLDLHELKEDLVAMWEDEDAASNPAQLIETAACDLNLADVPVAINDIFYVVRCIDETKAGNH